MVVDASLDFSKVDQMLFGTLWADLLMSMTTVVGAAVLGLVVEVGLDPRKISPGRDRTVVVLNLFLFRWIRE